MSKCRAAILFAKTISRALMSVDNVSLHWAKRAQVVTLRRTVDRIEQLSVDLYRISRVNNASFRSARLSSGAITKRFHSTACIRVYVPSKLRLAHVRGDDHGQHYFWISSV
jgi:hypothetical protein